MRIALVETLSRFARKTGGLQAVVGMPKNSSSDCSMRTAGPSKPNVEDSRNLSIASSKLTPGVDRRKYPSSTEVLATTCRQHEQSQNARIQSPDLLIQRLAATLPTRDRNDINSPQDEGMSIEAQGNEERFVAFSLVHVPFL